MEQDRPSSTARRFLGLKPGEGRIGVLFFSYFFLLTAPFTIIKAYRDGSYLDELGPENLPYAYATALVVGLFVALHSKLQARLSRPVLLVSSQVFFIVTGLLFVALHPLEWRWLPLAYWMWANLFVVVVMTQFWIAVNDVFNPREAKRLIGFFGSGGILGGILGGLLAGFLAVKGQEYKLLLLASAVLGLSILPVLVIFRGRQTDGDSWGVAGRPAAVKRTAGFRDCFDTVRKDSYLVLLASVVLLTGTISTFVDWQSKMIIDSWDVAKANLTSFFGFFSAGLLVFAFILQLFFTGGLIERYGLRLTLLFYPALLLACSLGIAFIPGVVLGLAIKGGDKILSYSLNQSARELLYIPVPGERKYRAKIFIDMFLNRFSKSFGAMVLLGVFLPFGPKLRMVSLVGAGLILAWVILNTRVSRGYVHLVKEKLAPHWGRGEQLVAEHMDVDSAKMVVDALESRTRSPILYAQHLFELMAQGKFTPEVRAFLASQMDEARIPSLGGLFESESAGWVPELSWTHEEDVLKKDVEEIFRLEPYQQVMKNYVDRVMTGEGGTVARMEVAKSLGWHDPNSPSVRALEDLLQDESKDVSRYAIESAAQLKRREYVPLLVAKLADAGLQRDALAALDKYGASISGTLADYVGDGQEDLGLRKRVVASLSGIANQEAVSLLLWELGRGRGDLDREIIDALDAVRAARPNLDFSPEVVRDRLFREMQSYVRSYLAAEKPATLAASDTASPRAQKLEVIRLNIFRLLGLVFPYEDILQAHQNLQAKTKDSVAYALELLDNLLPRDIKEELFPILEDMSEPERLKKFRALLRETEES